MKADKIFAELNRETKNMISGEIIGHQKIGDNTLKAFISSAKPITKSICSAIVSEHTNNKVLPYLDSMLVVKSNNKFVASVCCYRPKVKYHTEPNKLNQISASTFLDQDLGETWTKKIVDGEPIFLRSNEDDINKIVKELSLTASSHSKTSIRLPNIEKGMYAQVFIYNGEPNLLLGKIEKLNDNKAIIEFDSGIRKEIPITAINITLPTSVKTKSEAVEFLKLAVVPPGHEYNRQMDRMKQ